jgi:hypothetical protein
MLSEPPKFGSTPKHCTLHIATSLQQCEATFEYLSAALVGSFERSGSHLFIDPASHHSSQLAHGRDGAGSRDGEGAATDGAGSGIRPRPPTTPPRDNQSNTLRRPCSCAEWLLLMAVPVVLLLVAGSGVVVVLEEDWWCHVILKMRAARGEGATVYFATYLQLHNPVQCSMWRNSGPR